MLEFDLGREQKFDPVRHVEKVLGRIAEGDVTIACWEPGQTSPNHLHPNATEIYFCVEGGGVMRTPDATLDITPGAFVVHPPGELHEYSNGPARTILFRVRYGRDFSTARRTGRAIRPGAHDPRMPRSSPQRADQRRTSSTRRFFALPTSAVLSSTSAARRAQALMRINDALALRRADEAQDADLRGPAGDRASGRVVVAIENEMIGHPPPFALDQRIVVAIAEP